VNHRPPSLRSSPSQTLAKEAALADAQDLADVLLDAECKMGELLAANPPKGNTLTSTGGRKASLPENIDWKSSHRAQTQRDITSFYKMKLGDFFPELAKNQDVVEQGAMPSCQCFLVESRFLHRNLL
jgi:hypothetical protein